MKSGGPFDLLLPPDFRPEPERAPSAPRFTKPPRAKVKATNRRRGSAAKKARRAGR